MNVKIDIYLIISLIILFFLKQLDIFLLFYLFVFLHEVAHIIVALILKIKLIDIIFLPFGVNAKFDFEENHVKEIIIALAGPIFSLVSSIYIPKYRIQNLFIFISNIIPIYPLDGGRILKNLMTMLFGECKGTNIYNFLLRVLIIVLLIINIISIIFLKNFKFIFFSMYIIQMAGEEVKKDKLKLEIKKILGE